MALFRGQEQRRGLNLHLIPRPRLEAGVARLAPKSTRSASLLSMRIQMNRMGCLVLRRITRLIECVRRATAAITEASPTYGTSMFNLSMGTTDPPTVALPF